jgi:hypothetical protein
LQVLSSLALGLVCDVSVFAGTINLTTVANRSLGIRSGYKDGGTSGGNTFRHDDLSGPGNDHLNGGGGSNVLLGGDGDDMLIGEWG